MPTENEATITFFPWLSQSRGKTGVRRIKDRVFVQGYVGQRFEGTMESPHNAGNMIYIVTVAPPAPSVAVDFSLVSGLPQHNLLDRIPNDLLPEDLKEMAREGLHLMLDACQTHDLSPIANYLLDWEATAELEAAGDGNTDSGSIGEETKHSGIPWDEAVRRLSVS